MRFADLHTHTHHSDGTRSPSELVDLAVKYQIGILAISDHDQLGGYFEALAYAAEREIILVPATELSVTHRGWDIHLLAYAFDPTNEVLRSRLAELRESRRTRLDRIIDKLHEAGVEIDGNQVRALCGEGSAGRPHVARVLVANGVVRDVGEAFRVYLHQGGPAWVPKACMTASDAIELIRSCGGVLSVAHPTLYGEPMLVINELLDLGLDGIECIHPKIPPEWTQRLEKLARSRNLMITGGSDDHGFEDRGTFGSVRVPETNIGPILERLGAAC